MLFKETVTGQTLDILKCLMKDNIFNNFMLVGGTALSLRIGHRISLDLDMFTVQDFDQSKLNEHLHQAYGFSADFIDRNTLKGNIGKTALDFIAHKYDLIEKVISEEGIRMASLNDIAAMKLNAIVNNGTRVKDFVDVAFLNEHLTLHQMINGYEKKYKVNGMMVTKALLYHEDINHNIEIDLLPFPYDFKNIQNSLQTMVSFPHKTHALVDES